MKKFIRVDLILKYLKENNMSKAKFCRRAGISRGVFNKILNDKLNVKITAIYKVAKEIKTNTIFWN